MSKRPGFKSLLVAGFLAGLMLIAVGLAAGEGELAAIGALISFVFTPFYLLETWVYQRNRRQYLAGQKRPHKGD